MTTHRAMALFVATLLLALLGAAGHGDLHAADDDAAIRAAAAGPAVRS